MSFLNERNFIVCNLRPPDLVGALTPVNLHEEFERWMSSKDKSYNPRFLYDEKAIRKTYKSAVRLITTLAHLAEEYMQYDDWQAELTTELLVSQVEDLLATIENLEPIVKRRDLPIEKLNRAMERLFGKPTVRELDLSAKMTYKRKESMLVDDLIGEDERDQFSLEKLKVIVEGFLRNFKGILTTEENDKLTEKIVKEEQTVEIFRKVLRYISEESELKELHVRLCVADEIDRFGVAPLTAEVKAFRVDVPTEDLFADQLLQAVAHELNTHLRVMASTAKLQDAVSPYFRPSMVARTQRALAQEGFATLNGDSCIDDAFCCWFEPMLLLTPTYARQGHNFAEAARFVYETYNIDPSCEDNGIHRDIWTLSQIFYGIEDTSVRDGYTLPWMQVYFLGSLRTLKELARVDGEQFEEPLSLMRYSELPLEFIPKINRLEKQLGQKLTSDPFEKWDFANLKPEVMTPTEYCKHLLLEL